MKKIKILIGSMLIWIGYVLLSYPHQGIRKRFLQGISVQPVLLQSLSNLSCYANLSQKGILFVEHPFPRLCDSRSEHQLAQDLGATVLQWRRYPAPTGEEPERALRDAQSSSQEAQK